MATSTEEETIKIALKDSNYGHILRTIENNTLSKTAILTPMYSQEIDNILGEQDTRLGAGTSLAVYIIRTTKLLEDVANRDDLNESTKKLAVLHLQTRIRVLVLHLLLLNFPDIANLAVQTLKARPPNEERSRPIVPALCFVDVAEDMDTHLESVQIMFVASAMNSDLTTCRSTALNSMVLRPCTKGRTDSEGLGFSSCTVPLTQVCALNSDDIQRKSIGLPKERRRVRKDCPDPDECEKLPEGCGKNLEELPEITMRFCPGTDMCNGYSG
ncbi:uncharacterized protein F5147DRAFT_788508 [Suillus discolor]|uniref:Uncharacterized protein n=1 Tax=Suillus discolor TaxID=1912936 RepID=A0A9P7EUM5_9AGAM|nr:uncharacterized protein F5147DRAFT_788508 [Suillus discolor]KAG2089138.1 hypothetical protein F5147DRAFT_788508 [Suillus discolor]